MSFTTPKTWAFGEVLTSTDMNTYVRDNTAELKALVDAAGNEGIGPNVVQVVKTNTFSTTSSSYVDIPGLSATITPSSASSKVLIIANISYSGETTDAGPAFRISGGNAATFVGDAAGSRTRGIWHPRLGSGAYNYRQSLLPGGAVYLDSPNSTTPTTYSLQILTNIEVFINRSAEDDNVFMRGRGASNLILIEVAA